MDNANVSPGEPDSDEFRSYTLQLPCDDRAVRIARETLRAVLEAYGLTELADMAVLLASELVTNAIRHSEGHTWVRLTSWEKRVRVGVWDTDPCVPHAYVACLDPPEWPEEEAEEGRGLMLVRSCASDWGGYVLGEEPFGVAGKLLWFEVAA
jgi:anti-sigma regulatory factor (Ser/Thr protein kinase)